jgi:hypothetical protein
MKVKLFGDVTPVDWAALNIRMPFAPMHELAEKYELTEVKKSYIPALENNVDDLGHIFETDINVLDGRELFKRVKYRANNTVAALDRCTPDTICINLNGGYHHAGKYPNTGYAYSLINDHIWATDYQLERYNNIRIGIWDNDFHYAGGTIEYYKDSSQVDVFSEHAPLRGVLYKHQHLRQEGLGCYMFDLNTVDKVLLNLGTDYSTEDELFGQYAWYDRSWVMAFWKNTIMHVLEHRTPLAITFGGSYGDKGISMYKEIITFCQELPGL